MAKLLLPLPEQYFDDNGDPAAGYQIFTYVAGSSTKTATYTDSAGGSSHTNPVICDAAGRPTGGLIWGDSGVSYKIVVTTPTDTDPPVAATETWDDIIGVEQSASTQSQWLATGQTGTYIDATSFSVVGDQTATYIVDRRIQIADSGGTKYATIVSATFGTFTTIVVKGDALAASITSVSVGLLSATNDALPRLARTHTEGAAIASATTTDIQDSTGDTVHITGTTAITSFGVANRAGVVRNLVFDGILTLTNGASLILPSGANITTAAGDACVAISEDAAGAWRIHSYSPATGTPLNLSAPPAIGDTTPNTGGFTTLDATGNITVGGTVDGRDIAADGSALDIVVIGATRQTFTTSGTWTKPSGCKKALARVLGGGGAGGGVTGTGTGKGGGGGGGGGGYAEKMIDVSAIASSTITIGAGGTGVSGASGNAGGDSTWADGTNTVTGGGGGGGGGVTSNTTSTIGNGGSVGSGSGGDFNASGNVGDRANTDNNYNVGHGSNGGNSVLGGAGLGALANNTSLTGDAGNDYGGGGGGGANETSATNATGGAGADGIIIVEEFY